MNQMLLAKSAKKLEELLLRYTSVDAGVSELFDALSGLIDDARGGRITAPVEWRNVPGRYNFTEGGLQKYPDLETAYAEFKIEVTGGESPVLRKLRSSEGIKP